MYFLPSYKLLQLTLSETFFLLQKHNFKMSNYKRLRFLGLRTRKAYLDYITCLRYTILVRKP